MKLQSHPFTILSPSDDNQHSSHNHTSIYHNKQTKCDISTNICCVITPTAFKHKHQLISDMLTTAPVLCFTLIRLLFDQKVRQQYECNNNWQEADPLIGFVLLSHTGSSGSALAGERDVRACFLTPLFENERQDKKLRAMD